MHVEVDTRDFNKLYRELEKFKKSALPYAQRNALNGCAFELQRSWRQEVRSTFTNRNPFTERSIQVDKAVGLDTRSMRAITGSVAPYMGDQESGGTVRGRGGHKAIPAPYAGGGKPGGAARPKLVRQPFRLSSIVTARQPSGGYGPRRQNAIALAIAIRKGQRFALLNRAKGGGKGLFEVRGLKRSARVRLLWNVSKASVKVHPAPTMHRAAARSASAFQRIAQEALLAQLRRYRVMGY